MTQAEVIIVGGGVAGISCARSLLKRGIDFLLVERSDSLGGRVRSDLVDGFVLDRGFQVFNSSYFETLSLLADLSPEFYSFHSGSLVKTENGFYPLCDPLREPRCAFKTLFSPIGTLRDKLRMLLLRADSLGSNSFYTKSILEELDARGFSQSIINQFFRPFLGGIFLEPELLTSSLAFKEVFSNFSRGLAQLPKGGMGEISSRLALPLPKERILLGRNVVKISPRHVQLEDGESLYGKEIVLALDVDSLKTLFPELELPRTRTVFCFYFESNPLPEINRFLALNGSGKGRINNIAPVASVSPSYAPEGKELLSVSVITSPSITDLPSVQEIAKEVSEWFPDAKPRFIASYVIKGAQPEQLSGTKFTCANLPTNIHLCGDLVSMERYNSASIENAVRSGKELGEKLCL
jgi:phytoene dehydrogenase-like protein